MPTALSRQICSYLSHTCINNSFNLPVKVNMPRQSLADFVSRTMAENRISGYEVERRTNSEITQSYVNRIKNGEVLTPSAPKLKALAKGLGVSEDELFAVVRGLPVEASSFEKALQIAFHDAENWTKAEREEAINFVRTFAEGVRSRRSKNGKH